MQATIATAPRRPKKKVVQSDGPDVEDGAVAGARGRAQRDTRSGRRRSARAAPVPSAAAAARAAPADTVTPIATNDRHDAKLGSPGRKPSIEPSNAAPPYIAAAVYAISCLFRRSLASEGLTLHVSALGWRDSSPDGRYSRKLRGPSCPRGHGPRSGAAWRRPPGAPCCPGLGWGRYVNRSQRRQHVPLRRRESAGCRGLGRRARSRDRGPLRPQAPGLPRSRV